MNNALYFQSGGVTAVIGATAAALIEAHQTYATGTLFAAEQGLRGVLNEHLVNASALSASMRQNLRHVPGGGLGSGRTLLAPYAENPEVWQRIRDILVAHQIGTIYVNGGNGSMDTAAKLDELGRVFNLPLRVIGLPKTIDNDLVGTDTSPGFGSALKYLSVSLMEAARDHCAMATESSVFILEVMGRHTGWLATCGAVARLPAPMPSPLIVLPEMLFEPDKLVQAVKASFAQHPACVCVISEGIRTADGQFYGQQRTSEHYGHEQLGGAGLTVAALLRTQLGVKVHVAIPDYLQRAARHLASATDLAQAQAVAQHAVQLAKQGQSGLMVTIKRQQDTPYTWQCAAIPLSMVVNQERPVPQDWLDVSGFRLKAVAQHYLMPLIAGETDSLWHQGLPEYPWVTWEPVAPKLGP